MSQGPPTDTAATVGPLPDFDGVLVIDKPPGMTSHDVVGKVRHALGGGRRRRERPKVGHAGTLDPDATGVLVVCLGTATRLVPWLQASRKTYEARMRLGVTTATLDASGAVVDQRDPSAVDETRLCEALKAFVGEIMQIPPMVSAVRVGGERLHAKARRGEVVERQPRPVTIYDIVLEDFTPGPQAAASFFVTCSTGTYVRTLAADVGERLGCGAHLSALRRLGSGRFSVADAVALDDALDAIRGGRLAQIALSPAEAVADYPSVIVDAAAAVDIGHGRALASTGLAGPVAVLDADHRLLAMVADSDGKARALAVFAAAGRGPR